VRNCGDWSTFSVDFCVLYAESPPYFYVRFLLATDLESIHLASNRTTIISTSIEVDMTIHCRVTAFLLLIGYGTFDLDRWPFDRLPLVTFKNAYLSIAPAPDHVTCHRVSKTITQKYQTAVDQFWLTDWQTYAISEWSTADHVRQLLQRPLRICVCVKTKRFVWIFFINISICPSVCLSVRFFVAATVHSFGAILMLNCSNH